MSTATAVKAPAFGPEAGQRDLRLLGVTLYHLHDTGGQLVVTDEGYPARSQQAPQVDHVQEDAVEAVVAVDERQEETSDVRPAPLVGRPANVRRAGHPAVRLLRGLLAPACRDNE